MRSVLVSLWVWVAIGTLIVLWVPVMAVARVVDRDPAHYYAGYTLRILGRLLTYINPLWEVELEGASPDDPRTPYVVVGNHFSQADPPIISRVPWEMKWVAKKELFDLPFAGWLLRLSGDISVDRGSKKSRAAVLATAREYLATRCSVMFFPEGTRSRDGRVQRFSDGAFRLAIEEGVPVLPIAVDGTHEALPKHSIWFDPSPAPIRVRVLDPVDTDEYSPDQAQLLQWRVRAQIVQQIAAWRDVALDEADGRSDGEAAAANWVDAGPRAHKHRAGEAPPGEASVKPSARSGASEPGG